LTDREDRRTDRCDCCITCSCCLFACPPACLLAVLAANYHRNSLMLSDDARDLVHRESRAQFQSYQAKISALYARATATCFAEGFDAWVHAHRFHQSSILAFCLLHLCSPVRTEQSTDCADLTDDEMVNGR
jgi:hypothetical protein